MDRKAGAGHKAQGTRRITKTALCVLLASVVILFLAPCIMRQFSSFGAEKWSGVDEAVVEKIAGEHGRQASAPLMDTGQGDLPLFAFLVAGAVGGFAAGYYWRMLTEGKAQKG